MMDDGEGEVSPSLQSLTAFPLPPLLGATAPKTPPAFTGISPSPIPHNPFLIPNYKNAESTPE
jgi:hypothetical protein